MKALRISHAFATRVNKTTIPDYYDIVKEPVCIEDINTSVMYGEYKNKGDFLADFQKMYKNSVAYNGKNDQVNSYSIQLVKNPDSQFSFLHSALQGRTHHLQRGQGLAQKVPTVCH